jgi:hypothetical protein
LDWNTEPSRPIIPVWMTHRTKSPRADWEPSPPSQAEVRASLVRSDADIAAGRTVPASIVHAELQAALDRIEARRTQLRGAMAQR